MGKPSPAETRIPVRLRELFPYVGKLQRPEVEGALQIFLQHHSPEDTVRLAGFLAAHVLRGTPIKATKRGVQQQLGFDFKNEAAFKAAQTLKEHAMKTLREIEDFRRSLQLEPGETKARREISGLDLELSLSEFAEALANKIDSEKAREHYTHSSRIYATLVLSRVDRSHFKGREDQIASLPRKDERQDAWNFYANGKFKTRRVQRLVRLYENALQFLEGGRIEGRTPPEQLSIGFEEEE